MSYSPDGEKLLVSGSANFVRCFKTGDAGEPDIFNDTQEDSAGIIAGVCTKQDYCDNQDLRYTRMISGLVLQRMGRSASIQCLTEVWTRCLSGAHYRFEILH